MGSLISKLFDFVREAMDFDLDQGFTDQNQLVQDKTNKKSRTRTRKSCETQEQLGRGPSRPPQDVDVLDVLDFKFLVSVLRLLLCIPDVCWDEGHGQKLGRPRKFWWRERRLRISGTARKSAVEPLDQVHLRIPVHVSLTSMTYCEDLSRLSADSSSISDSDLIFFLSFSSVLVHESSWIIN